MEINDESWEGFRDFKIMFWDSEETVDVIFSDMKLFSKLMWDSLEESKDHENWLELSPTEVVPWALRLLWDWRENIIFFRPNDGLIK